MSQSNVSFPALFAAGVLWLGNAPQVLAQGLTDPPEIDSSHFFTWTYKSAPMGFYLPPASVEKPPVVMYLHYCTGNPVSENFWIVPALNAIEPTAVFLPTAPAEVNTQYPCADWGGTYDQTIRANMVNALHELDSLIQVHGLDSSRVYVYGESMGGEGVYRLLMDFPHRFAGAVVAAGYTVNKGAKQMTSTPLWIFHGSDDQTSPVDNARTIYQSIQDSGGTLVEYTEYEGYDHTPAINKAHSEPGLLEWLLAKTLATTGIRYGRLPESSQSSGMVSYTNGQIRFSPTVQVGAEFSLYTSSGALLYRGVVSQLIMPVPQFANTQVLHWRLQEQTRVYSGAMVP